MSVRRLVEIPYTTPRLEKFGQVHTRNLKSEHVKAKVDTVYLYNARIACHSGWVHDKEFTVVLPYAHLNSYDYTSKKGSQKQHVLTQITLFDKSPLEPNTEYFVFGVNGILFNMEGKTDDTGRLTARSEEYIPKPFKSAVSPPLEMPVKVVPLAEPPASWCGCALI